LNEMEAL